MILGPGLCREISVPYSRDELEFPSRLDSGGKALLDFPGVVLSRLDSAGA
jgi:hypothetical protein